MAEDQGTNNGRGGAVAEQPSHGEMIRTRRVPIGAELARRRGAFPGLGTELPDDRRDPER